MKKSRSISIILVIILITTILTTIAMADVPTNTIQVYVNSKQITFPDAQPFIDNNNRCQVPIRFIAESLGYKVEWNQEKRQATITGNETTIVLTLISNKALVNGQTVTFDTYVVLKDGRTFVPLRFVSENLGAKVEYNYVNKVHRIDITTANGGTAGSTTSIGTITGFTPLEKGKTPEGVVANIKSLATAVHKDSVFIKIENNDLSILAFNPQSKIDNIGDAWLSVVSTTAHDYEVLITALVWPIPEYKDNEYVVAVAKYTKEILKQYFPTKYEEVYKLMDSCFNDGRQIDKVYKFDNREVICRTTGIYISPIGGTVNSVTPK